MGDNAARRIIVADDCLQVVERSPAAVAVHDRAAWLALFAARCVVEDPVGSQPLVCEGARGRETLGRFYDTFIAPNRIRFHPTRDFVCGLHVMRDLDLEIGMSRAVTVRVPMHLLYELANEEGGLRIARLAAHWELWPMLRQQLAGGWRFLGVGTASGLRMLRHQGVRGMAGFAAARASVGEAGKQQAAQFARYFNRGDGAALRGLFADPQPHIGFPHGSSRALDACLARGGSMQFSKVLAAGSAVTATLRYESPAGAVDGVALFQLARDSHRIETLRFYW